MTVRGEPRAEVGVGRGRREPLVLAELRQHVTGQRDVQLGQGLPQRVPDQLLMRRMDEREEQAHRDGLDVRGGDRFDRPPHRGRIDRHDNAVRPDPLGDREAEVPRHKRLGRRQRQVVERGPVLAGNLDHVAEVLRGHQCGAGAPPFEQRVRRDGRPMRDRRDLTWLETRRVDRRHHAQ
jgi:hypothetical protein